MISVKVQYSKTQSGATVQSQSSIISCTPTFRFRRPFQPEASPRLPPPRTSFLPPEGLSQTPFQLLSFHIFAPLRIWPPRRTSFLPRNIADRRRIFQFLPGPLVAICPISAFERLCISPRLGAVSSAGAYESSEPLSDEN